MKTWTRNSGKKVGVFGIYSTRRGVEEIKRAKDVLKAMGAEDVTSTGEASVDRDAKAARTTYESSEPKAEETGLRFPPFFRRATVGLWKIDRLTEREDYDEERSHSNRDSNVSLGAVIGAAAALLLAPKAGEELRDDIAEGLSDGVDGVRKASRDLKRRAQRIVDGAKDQVQDAIDAGDRAYSHAKNA